MSDITVSQIALELRKTTSTVHNHRRKLGIGTQHSIGGLSIWTFTEDEAKDLKLSILTQKMGRKPHVREPQGK